MSKSLRVLLTGGAGFIASHVAEALLREGHTLSILDNLDDFYAVERKRRNLNSIREVGDFNFYECDIRDSDQVRSLMQTSRPEIVIHLAARAGVRPSIDHPSLYESVNVAGTLNLLELARQFQVQRFIFGSSSSVYGCTNRVPFSEDDPVSRPISPYAATKIAGELLAHTYAHLYGLSTICLRFFTVYGPRQRPDLAVHKFISLMEEDRPIPVFGDGSSGRDYTYIDDIVSGVLAALRFEFANDPSFEVFNLGNSHPVTLKELIEHLEEASGRKAIRNAQPQQPGDMSLTWASIEKSKLMLGYAPQVSLQEGLKRFVAWYRGARS